MSDSADATLREFLQNLNNEDLRKQLLSAGINVGPITPTTRRLYTDRLVRKYSITPEPENTDSEENAENSNDNNSAKSQSLTKSCRPLKEKAKNHKGLNIYYGVFIPKSDSENDVREPLVFDNIAEVLLTIKGHRNARFKDFRSMESAEEYSVNGAEDATKNTQASNLEFDNLRAKFPTLKQEDLNKLTRLIENGDVTTMLELIRLNPKYLISSADGPVSLKPNTRYNALHIASKSNKPEMCKEILNLLQNIEFQKLMFPNTNDGNITKHRTEHLLNSYLNTPEKILFETPLHLACKLGYKDVVEVLVNYPSCSTSALNKYGKRPIDIVCSRGSSSAQKSEIEQLLKEHYYVPLLRYHDNTQSPVVGKPILTKQNPKQLSDLRSPEHASFSVRALAGPMIKEKASIFHKDWMSPSKRKDLGAHFRYVRRSDSEKGEEQIGRELASKDNVGWIEFWDFLNDFANFTTEEGLEKLENYLRVKSTSISDTSQEIQDLSNKFDEIELSRSRDMLRMTPDSLKHGRPSDPKTAFENHDTAAVNSVEFSIPQNDLICNSICKTCHVHHENSVDNTTKQLSVMTVEPNQCEELYYRYRENSSTGISNMSTSDYSIASSNLSKTKLFLAGRYPTKCDQDVITAIGNRDIDSDRFPLVAEWKSSVLSFSEDVRLKWMTPRKQRKILNGVPSTTSTSSFSPSPSSGQGLGVSPAPVTDLRRILFEQDTPPSRFLHRQFL